MYHRPFPPSHNAHGAPFHQDTMYYGTVGDNTFQLGQQPTHHHHTMPPQQQHPSVFDRIHHNQMHQPSQQQNNIELPEWLFYPESDAEPIRRAAKNGDIHSLRHLTSSGEAGDYLTDSFGRTPLHYAAAAGNFDCVKFLLINCGSDCDLEDYFGCTALYYAASAGHIDVAQALLKEGCLVDRQCYKTGNSALHEAVSRGLSSITVVLIRAKANVYLGNLDGSTPLHVAAQKRHSQCARILLYSGCSPNVKNAFGDTPLHTSARYDAVGVVRALLAAGVHVDETNRNGDTTLHICAAFRRFKIAKLLLEQQSSVKIRNEQQDTAIDIAVRKMHDEMVDLLTIHSKHLKCPQQDTKGGASQFISHPQSNGHGHQNPQHIRKKGFFNEYVSKDGMQYYKDLAGNVRQGPMGYVPKSQQQLAQQQLQRAAEERNTLTNRYSCQINPSDVPIMAPLHNDHVMMTKDHAFLVPAETRKSKKRQKNGWKLFNKQSKERDQNNAQEVKEKGWVEKRMDILVKKIFPWKKSKLANAQRRVDRKQKGFLPNCTIDDDNVSEMSIMEEETFEERRARPRELPQEQGGYKLRRTCSDETLSVSEYKCQTWKKYHKLTKKLALDDNRIDTDMGVRVGSKLHPFAPGCMVIDGKPGGDPRFFQGGVRQLPNGRPRGMASYESLSPPPAPENNNDQQFFNDASILEDPDVSMMSSVYSMLPKKASYPNKPRVPPPSPTRMAQMRFQPDDVSDVHEMSAFLRDQGVVQPSDEAYRRMLNRPAAIIDESAVKPLNQTIDLGDTTGNKQKGDTLGPMADFLDKLKHEQSFNGHRAKYGTLPKNVFSPLKQKTPVTSKQPTMGTSITHTKNQTTSPHRHNNRLTASSLFSGFKPPEKFQSNGNSNTAPPTVQKQEPNNNEEESQSPGIISHHSSGYDSSQSSAVHLRNLGMNPQQLAVSRSGNRTPVKQRQDCHHTSTIAAGAPSVSSTSSDFHPQTPDTIVKCHQGVRLRDMTAQQPALSRWMPESGEDKRASFNDASFVAIKDRLPYADALLPTSSEV